MHHLSLHQTLIPHVQLFIKSCEFLSLKYALNLIFYLYPHSHGFSSAMLHLLPGLLQSSNYLSQPFIFPPFKAILYTVAWLIFLKYN